MPVKLFGLYNISSLCDLANFDVDIFTVQRQKHPVALNWMPEDRARAGCQSLTALILMDRCIMIHVHVHKHKKNSDVTEHQMLPLGNQFLAKPTLKYKKMP